MVLETSTKNWNIIVKHNFTAGEQSRSPVRTGMYHEIMRTKKTPQITRYRKIAVASSVIPWTKGNCRMCGRKKPLVLQRFAYGLASVREVMGAAGYDNKGKNNQPHAYKICI